MVDEILCYLASYLCYHLIQPFLPDIVMPHGQIGIGIPCGGYSCFHRCSAGGSTWPSAILISLLPSESCLLSLCYLLFLFCSLWATFWPTHQFFPNVNCIGLLLFLLQLNACSGLKLLRSPIGNLFIFLMK